MSCRVSPKTWVFDLIISFLKWIKRYCMLGSSSSHPNSSHYLFFLFFSGSSTSSFRFALSEDIFIINFIRLYLNLTFIIRIFEILNCFYFHLNYLIKVMLFYFCYKAWLSESANTICLPKHLDTLFWFKNNNKVLQITY